MLQSRDKKSNSNTRRGDNSKSKKAKIVILVCDMSGSVLHYYQVLSKYSKECSTYIADTKSMHNQWQIQRREITAKVRKAELSYSTVLQGTTKYSEGYSSYRADEKSISNIIK